MSAGEADTMTAAPHGAGEPLGPGKAIGRYTIDRVLGQGGMGVVYAAHDPDLDRAVALKLLLGQGDDVARARLLREARAMARLSHANVITVFEVDTIGGRDFVAMELIDGSSVDWWLNTPRALTEILDVFLQAARGLAAAHDKGLVHRDFKPHNVLVGRDGKVVVTDFGLARAAGSETSAAAGSETAAVAVTGAATVPANPIRGDEATLAPPAAKTPSASPSWSNTITATGALLGTPAYMAPEQWEGANTDPRSDQFAYCVSLWEAVAGQRPYRGDDFAKLRAAAAAGPPPAPKGMPAWLAPILRRGLAVDPAARWPSMTAVIDAIEHGRGRGRRRTIAASVAVALLVGGGATAVAVGRGGGKSGSGTGGGTENARAIAGTVGAVGAPSSMDSVCQPIDTAAAGLWSTERREQQRAHLAAMPELAGFFDRYYASLTTRWRDAYERTCTARADRQRLARVACLEGWRDSVAGVLDGLAAVPAESLRYMPVAEITPALEACTGATPVMPAAAPTPAQREQVRALRAKSFVIGFSDASPDDPRWIAHREEAEATGYPIAVLEIDAIRAGMREIGGDLAGARRAYAELAIAAEALGATQLRADALIGVASVDVDSKQAPDVIDASMKAARSAIAAAGSAPIQVLLLDELDTLLAEARGDLDAVIEILSRLQPRYIELHSTRRATRTTERLAKALHARDRTGDRERAQALLATESKRQLGELGPIAGDSAFLDEVRQELAGRR